MGLDITALAAKDKTQPTPNDETKAPAREQARQDSNLPEGAAGDKAPKDRDGKDVTSGTGHAVVDSASQPTGDAATTDVHWSSRIPNLRVGKFVFDNGLLHITDKDDAAEFAELYKKLPAIDQNTIQKLDVGAADAWVRTKIGGGLTDAFDSSQNRSRDTIGGEKTVGDTAIDQTDAPAGVEGHAKLAQRDNNLPVTGTNVVTEANATDLAKESDNAGEGNGA